jgi:hypothetical protein
MANLVIRQWLFYTEGAKKTLCAFGVVLLFIILKTGIGQSYR